MAHHVPVTSPMQVYATPRRIVPARASWAYPCPKEYRSCRGIGGHFGRLAVTPISGGATQGSDAGAALCFGTPCNTVRSRLCSILSGYIEIK